MQRFIDYLILSLILAFTFTMGYIFTTATMVILYSLVYAVTDAGRSGNS